MRVVVFGKSGAREELQVREVSIDEPAPGEIRLKITSIGLNRADSLFREGRYFYKPDFAGPDGLSRLGFEGAGIVDAVGEGVDWSPGDRVAVIPVNVNVSQQGCLAEYGLYPQNALISTPDSISDENAGGIWMPYLTAWGGLVTEGGLQKGQTAVITAASSSVGIAAIQIANMLGTTSIATTTSGDKVNQLKQYGADHVINMKADNYVDKIKQITDGRGTDLVFDAVAGPATRELVRGSATGGKLIIQGMLDRRPMDIHAGVLMKRQLTVKGFMVNQIFNHKTLLQQAVQGITTGLDRRQLHPVFSGHYPLERVQDAFALLESNRHTGKILINP